MKQEKMMELWRKEFESSYYSGIVTPRVTEYLEGKTDELKGMLTSNGAKYYASYVPWIVKELDGENHELARRMLVVISKIRSAGLISNTYLLTEDAEIALRIGYDFDSLIAQTVDKYKNISADILYNLAKILLKYCPEEATDYANQLLTSKLKKLLEIRKSNRSPYLALYLACELIKKDPSANSKYIPALIDFGTKLKNPYITLLLYRSHEASPQLTELLREHITTDAAAPYDVYQEMKPTEFVPFLQKIGAPLWPYYYIVAMYDLPNQDKTAILNQLYQDDNATFMDLYNRLVNSKAGNEQLMIPYLLAIRLKNGESMEDPVKINLLMQGLFKRLLAEFSEKQPLDPTYSDESVPVSEVDTIEFARNLSWGNAAIIIGGFNVLYDYSSRARRFTQLLLTKQPNTTATMDNEIFVLGYFLRERKKWLSISPKESMQTLFGIGLTIETTFRAYCCANYWYGNIRNAIAEALTKEYILEHKELAINFLMKNKMSVDQNLIWVELLYQEMKLEAHQPLFMILAGKSKLLRKKAEEIIEENEAVYRPLVEKEMEEWKGDALASAKRLIKKWDNDRKFGTNFSFTDNATVIEYCQDNYEKNNQKFISWIPEEMLADVRFIDLKEKAPTIVLKYILSEYMALQEAYRIKACDKVVDRLNPQDFQGTLENIYQLWKDNGAEAKKKLIMVPYCLYASDSQILRLKTQLKDWGDASRGAIAAFVTNAIAMNGGSVALMMIDGIAIKFPHNQVKNAAKAAFAFAAKALDIPEDELSDKIVPTLGFGKDGEKELDYGTRTFKITLMPDFTLTIYDNDKKKIVKSMPAPGANDDTVKATAAKKEFSELKKQMKAAVQTQTNRLEKVLMNGRCWNVKAWNDLFVENPIMHRFATGLIWGVYNDNKLIETFRYMDDGTFNTVDEDEYTLPADATITLVHPIELTAEQLAQWNEQLDDYEVTQPLPQLSAPVVRLQPEDISDKKVIRYQSAVVKSGKISAIARKHNLVRGEVWDAGSFTVYHWVDKYLGIAAQLNFEYMWMGQEYNEDVILKDVIFYRLGEEGQAQEEPQANAIVDPSEIPERFVSTVIGVFDTLKEE